MDAAGRLAVEIRRVGAEEWQLLRSGRLQSLRDEPEAFGQRLEDATATPEPEWRAMARRSSAGDRHAWFLALRPDPAWEGSGTMPGRVIGLVQGRRRPPSDLMVFSMWVDPTSRRLGLGRRLIEAVEGWARGWGGSRVVLWVYSGNESAMRFYRRLGFDLVRVGPDADAGVPHGALAMERALTG